MQLAIFAVLALQSSIPTVPPPFCTAAGYCTVPEVNIGNGMKSNSPPPKMVTIQTPSPAVGYSPPPPAGRANAAEPLIVMPSSGMSLPLAVAAEPQLGPGRHNLVVHWPDARRGADFQRSFKTGAGCLRARAAVLDEHRRRTSAIAVNMANRGTILAVMLEAPYAVCLPLD